MEPILERAKQNPLPLAAHNYESPKLRLLVALCRELQREAGGEPFFLSCRAAAQFLDLGKDHPTAWKHLGRLIHDGIIEEVEHGTLAGRRASTYRYVATDGPAA